MMAMASASTKYSGLARDWTPIRVLAGAWSRRITEEHRLVYAVSAERVDFLQARYHY